MAVGGRCAESGVCVCECVWTHALNTLSKNNYHPNNGIRHLLYDNVIHFYMNLNIYYYIRSNCCQLLLLLNGCAWFINLDKFGEWRMLLFSCVSHFSYFQFFHLFISLAVSTSERQVSIRALL